MCSNKALSELNIGRTGGRTYKLTYRDKGNLYRYLYFLFLQGGDTIVYAALEPDLNEKETTGKYTVRCKAYSNVTKSFIKKTTWHNIPSYANYLNEWVLCK